MTARVTVWVPLAVAALAAMALVAAASGTAGAASKKRIIPTPDRSGLEIRAATRLARAIAVNRRHVIRGRFSTLPPFGDPAGISTKRLAGFPLHGRSFGILSNGNVGRADNRNRFGDLSTQLGGPSIRGARDVVILRILLRVPSGRSCLSIRFRFLSEEFPEFVNEEFNDAFIAELDASSWRAGTRFSPAITSPRNFAFDTRGNPIRVNSVGDTSVTARRARGTTYDGATRRLRASTPIDSGRHILYLSIFDQGDRDYDSAVFLDRLTLDNRRPCTPGAVRD